MGKPDADDTEINAATGAIRRDYGSVIGEDQARNIAHTALVAARAAKSMAEREARTASTAAQSKYL